MENNETVRVLVVCALGFGGVSTLMTNIQTRLNREKINFDYLVFHEEKPYRADQVEAMGSNIYVATVDHLKSQALRRIARMRIITKICRENKIQIMHYNADFPADLTNVLAAKMGGVKYITMHAHNASFTVPGKSVKIISKILKPFIPFFADNFWACSNLAGNFVFPPNVKTSDRYAMIPNGIDLEKFDLDYKIRDGLRNQMGVANKFVVGHAGRFVEQKNHQYLIKIFAAIHAKDSEAVFWLFGDGPLEEEIKGEVKKKGLDDVITFFGVSDRMNEMWQAMDVFVMPSLHEGLPVTGIEAQASGLPCVFSDTITKEVDVSKQSVFVSLEEKPEYWANMVLQLKNKKRASKVNKLREMNYDIQQMTETFSEHYLKIAKQIIHT